VRAFHPSDQNAARALIETGLGEHFGFIDRDANPDLIDIAATYAAPHAFYVAELDGTIVGTTGLRIEAGAARMVRLGVASEHRRSGIASALLDAVFESAARAGVDAIVAHTQPEWPDAMRFYAAHGFVAYGRDDVDVYLRRRVSGAAT
jgi:GNAT superfamily N-acetyltransferase